MPSYRIAVIGWWQRDVRGASTVLVSMASVSWMVNFRVADLDAMIRQLEAAHIDVDAREEWNSEVGRFARIHDPDGNPVELWEPSL